MPDEPQNPIPEENSIPASPQEPILDALISPSTSELAPMPPEVPEAPPEAESAIPVNNDNGEISLPEAENPAPEPTAQTLPIEPSNKPDITIERTPDSV